MASLIDITRNAENLKAAQLNTYGDFGDAMNFVHPAGYYGTITLSSDGVWQMHLQNSNDSTTQIANLGDWLIINVDATGKPIKARVSTQQTAPSEYSPK